MKVIDLIVSSKKTIFSFELLPPLKGQNADKLYETIDELIEYNPRYINLTTHRDEIEYRPLDNGLLEKKIVRKRPGTVAIAAAIQHKYGIPVVPHVVCGGFTREETENMLIDLNFLGIKNILALRGDGLRSDNQFIPEKNGHAHANELVEQIVHLREGKYLDPDLKNKSSLDFCIGVAGYPEKHAEASNPETDLNFLKQKVDAGAEYIVTQMFFDNQKYYAFVDRCRAAGIMVPIIPGIKPLALMNQITMLPKIFSIDIPEEFAAEVRKCKTNDEARQVGTEWAIHQAKDLVANKVPCLHIYTYGITDNTRQIAKTIL
jgi:methylenetetrahydrofolate reductase (NADPH)